jgi:hypothetical protein
MKKIAILGKLQTKYKAPFDDSDWQIWSMNLHADAKFIPRVDKWFDLHKKPDNINADYLKNNFDFDACRRLVGGNYFNNTVSFMIAFAILQGATHINLYGMRFECDHERRHGEYQNVRELVFFARGRGIIVEAPFDEIMLKDLPIYSDTDSRDFDLY